MNTQQNTASDVAERQLPLTGEVGGSPFERDVAKAERAGMPHVPEVLDGDPGFTAGAELDTAGLRASAHESELRVLLVLAQRHFHRRRDRKGIIGKAKLSGRSAGEATGLYRQQRVAAWHAGLVSKGAVRVLQTDGRGLRTLAIVEPDWAECPPNQWTAQGGQRYRPISKHRLGGQPARTTDWAECPSNTGSGKEVKTKEGGAAQAAPAESSSKERAHAPDADAGRAAPPPHDAGMKGKGKGKGKGQGGLNGEGQGQATLRSAEAVTRKAFRQLANDRRQPSPSRNRHTTTRPARHQCQTILQVKCCRSSRLWHVRSE